MAAMWKSAGQRLSAVVFSNRACFKDGILPRCIGTGIIRPSQSAAEIPDQPESKGWLKSLLNVRTIAPSKESHSSVLSKKECVYELQIHCVKPEYMEEYIKDFGIFQQLMHDKQTGAGLIGSFTVEIGDQDQAIHIWSYKGGYPVLNNANTIYRTDKDFIEFRTRRNQMLRSRSNQIMLAFSFWPEPVPRPAKNIYELRSYVLKPGTMIEWGNNWAKGIKSRETNHEPVAGFFSQMGELNTVQHLWVGDFSCSHLEANLLSLSRPCPVLVFGIADDIKGDFQHPFDYIGYTDLQTRKETRESAWQKPGWDECVAYTVPLIRHMQSRILIPTPFSPLQ